jgi:hypothetical protein
MAYEIAVQIAVEVGEDEATGEEVAVGISDRQNSGHRD